MFEMKSSLDLAKQKLFSMIKLIYKPEEQPNVSSPVVLYELPNLRVNLREADLKKAQALVYWHVSNRPT